MREHLRDDGEQRLRCRPGLRPRGTLVLGALRGALLLLGLGSGDRVLRGLGLGLEHLDHLERQLQVTRLATQPLEFAALLGQRLEQDRVLRLERLRDPAQLLDVLLAREVDVEGHAFLLITSRGPKQEVSHDLDRRQRVLADERAALDEQRELAGGEPYDLAVVAPQLGERRSLQSLLKMHRPVPSHTSTLHSLRAWFTNRNSSPLSGSRCSPVCTSP
ncbi:MAG TPA: hypothetical protein VFP84_12150 [Kofleriaceae bacterium]|nr:hypothetical protein [Kofleriaceae bacterium]